MDDPDALPPGASAPPTADVRPFPRQVKLPCAPVPAVVTMLETLLGYARTGQLQGVAVAVVYADGLVAGGEINSGWANGEGTYFAMNCAIEKLHRARGRYCDNLPEPGESYGPAPEPPAA